ncbi:malate synthase [Pseudooceanicola batsensis HTCC2597]|uniref:Malate synthase G n=1 Tax=Pseudooceanicola batsensis (strain ATCC BAA-863 / DSM 15984 / KCTC 12145 / HTCC2597) TaxID=252305 RepID=A3TWK6_PSEBH|nr:malate synthase G [Pseudooceanicola batsensis]EAQ04002.1 malate synthase [Pseudooceanicola batsensis HTCC2597]
MTDYVERAGLQVADVIAELVEDRILPGLDIRAEEFWNGYARMLADLVPENLRLLDVRDHLQAQIDAWAADRKGQDIDPAEYRAFLEEIGYIVPEGPDFEIRTENVDPEVARVAGPQLVVPVMNARFALNAANARWGSLYDALYGTDALPGAPKGPGYDPERGAQAVAWAARFLDEAVPLEGASHADVTAYRRDGAALVAMVGEKAHGFSDPGAFVGYSEEGDTASYMLRHNGLHIELVIDPSHPVGAASPSGLRDVVIESALTAIQDCEDSVAAVDAADKAEVYGNWLGLMKGDLTETFEKGGQTMTRRLNPDKELTAPDGSDLVLPGRALLLVRNVGHLMTTDAVLFEGEETPEGMLDALVTVACAMHDLKKTDGPRNSRCGSVYVVKPKMHGPDEVAFADALYAEVEAVLGLPKYTVKLGVMDEERRTSANLRECMRAVKNRLVFINTGFLDRTGDEIHTSMHLGPFIPKGEMAGSLWLGAYEDGNVDAGLSLGLRGRGQIGKGMWAKPDRMAEMLEAKTNHPMAGANTAWVPSPTAATLHATHYHQIDVSQRQDELTSRERPRLVDLLTPPVLGGRNLTEDEVRRDLDNNCQGILGYVVRWIDQGVGCSKVPDINDVGLMEDRATLRISSQYLANWLLHGLITEDEVEAALRRMAAKVDAQNAGDPAYRPLADNPEGPAFQAARDLIFKGVSQPSGYTEPLLHAWRRRAKEEQA